MAQLSPHKHPTSLNSSLGKSPFPSSSNPDFTPRKEFIRGHRVTSSFALLTLSGSGNVRLFRFPQPVEDALHSYFHQRGILQYCRKDNSKRSSEYTILGRPWTVPRTIMAEKLIIDILTIILQHGFILLSTLDYGREKDDNLAISFSKPMSTSIGNTSTGALINGSEVSLNVPIRTPFAVSFLTATRVRVISPPRSSTPAILQSMRGAWPGGVVDESTVEETNFEFKLKGYKWFGANTFGADSLHLILALLESLDQHGFSLLTSFPLFKRSKTRDFWIFVDSGATTVPGVGPVPGTTTTSPAASNSDLIRELTPPDGRKYSTISNGKSLPLHSSPLADSRHNRSASDGMPFTSSPPKTGTFPSIASIFGRGPSSKHHPISPVAEVSESGVTSPEQSPAMGASSIASCDMTGVGLNRLTVGLDVPEIITPNQLKSMQDEQHGPLDMAYDSPYPIFKRTLSTNPDSSVRASTAPYDMSTRYSSTRPPEQRMLNVEVPSQNGHLSGFTDNRKSSQGRTMSHILPGAFRDSTLSSQTAGTMSGNWGGRPQELVDRLKTVINNNPPPGSDPYVAGQQHSPQEQEDRNTPSVGARHLSQRDAERNDVYRVTFPANKEQSSSEEGIPPEIRLAMSFSTDDPSINKRGDVRIGSPTKTRVVNPPAQGVRRSEKPDIVVDDKGNHSPTREKRQKKEKKEKKPKQPGAPERLDSGWVMVNIEPKKATGDTTTLPGSGRRTQSPPTSSRPSPVTRGSSQSQSPSSRTGSPGDPPVGNAGQGSMSAAVKSIAMMDAVEAKEQKEKSKANFPLKRLFGRGPDPSDSNSTPRAEEQSSRERSREVDQMNRSRERSDGVSSARHRERRVG